MPWARASELDRIIACPAAGHLTRVSDNPGEAALWGTAVHRWKETGQWWEDSLVTRRRAAALVSHDMSRESLWPPEGEHEATYALYRDEKVIRPTGADALNVNAWKEALSGQYCVGTADYVGEVLGDPWIDDLKTGRDVPEDPWDLWQLRFYAVCVAIYRPRAQWFHVSITHWPRYPADDPPRRFFSSPKSRQEVLSCLETIESARLAVLDSAADIAPHATPGDHCRYCRAQPNCPVWAKDSLP